MNYIVFGLQTQLTVAATTVDATVTVPQDAEGMYISADQTLRVVVDGVTVPSATVGLYCPANVTTLLATKPQTTLSVFNTGASAANVSIQFLGT